MSTFNILAFDGGGIKGALSARILLKVCERYPNFLEQFDLFAGTSTGSLIALSLAYGKNAEFLDTLYSYEVTKFIFSPKRINLCKPKYSNKRLKKLLNDFFPNDCKIEDLNKYVFIPAFHVRGLDNKGWTPVFFNNLSPNPTSKYSIIDAAIASSAAPTYFPSHKGFIDGGVVASSPTTVSAFSALSNIPHIKTSTNIRILSIGTGNSPDKITSNSANWGVAQWIFDPFIKMNSPLVSIMLDGTPLVDDIYCKQIFGDNYFRINPLVDKHIEMDDYKFVPYLKQIADETDLNELYKYIEQKILCSSKKTYGM